MKLKLPVQVIFREYFEGILAAIFLALFLRLFVFSILYIPGDNMSPGLLRGDFVVGWKLAYGLPIPLQKDGKRLNPKPPKRGDLISLRFPGDEEQILIRRIVGLPGERIKIQDGQLSIDGDDGQYVTDSDQVVEILRGGDDPNPIRLDKKANMDEMLIPQKSYFVLSDNRSHGDDSQVWGVVPAKNIESRLGFIWLSIDADGGGFRLRWNRLFKKL